MDGNLTPDTRISAAALRLTPEAVEAAERAVDHAFDTLERTGLPLPDWADFNLFRVLFGHIRKKQTRVATEMTLEQFGAELKDIVEYVVEVAEGINQDRQSKSSSELDVPALRAQMQSVCDAALEAAQSAMGQTQPLTSCETHPAR